ncbi:exo-1,3-beta-D-glucanase [Stachybotrys elegans]|uniref:Exo-1,3-beta-D-glucanase n=1 Tax=Stachybotrys elegans TaxID=80388 RepID=A0A8K0WJ69_9HYPO|nr:exo-1,3-beta-D-glucanase [Stachybotrys elegans]
MLFRSSCAWLLAAALGASCTRLSGSAPTEVDMSPKDISAFIDDFVEEWRANNPSLDAAEVQRIMASAESAKKAMTGAESDKRDSAPPPPPLPVLPRRRAANSTLSEAKALIRQAQKEADARNRERFDNPRTNIYWSHLSPHAALRARAEDAATFVVNETVAAAAAIVAEAEHGHDAPKTYPPLPANILELQEKMIGTEDRHAGLGKRADSGFWMEDIAHQGRVPFGGSANDGYKVFRNVKDYGAVGDGRTDDTVAINRAMSDQGRCGGSANCGASTIKPAIIYFPSGTYLVSSPITAYYNTQMIGNANSRPIIKAAKSFIGLGVISSDEYTGGNGGAEQWYINQNNFLRQLRNFIVDVTEADMDNIAGVHWQVAQATSIQSVTFQQSPSRDKHHMGVFAENGSGGWMADLVFVNGHIGMQCGNQQFTSVNLVFTGCRTAIDMLWDWGWTWKNLLISSTEYGIKMSNEYRGGSLVLLDSILIGMSKGIYVKSPVGSTPSEKFSVTLDTVDFINVGTAVHHETAGVTLEGGTRFVDSWVLGKAYDEKNPRGTQHSGPLSAKHPTSGPLSLGGYYYVRNKPQMQNFAASDFANARSFDASGDGVSDDTFQLQLAITLSRAMGRPLYIPFGSYLITQTITIPPGSVIVGECWAQLVATGGFFGFMDYPQPMIRVGEPDDKGVVEIQDLLLTTKGPTPGVVLMEWNMAESSQGSAAMWDTHFRIGGAQGTGLTAKDCPKLTGSVNPKCIGGSMLLHMTDTSSGYLENVWAWVADHDFDSGPAQTQIDIYVARGILIESRGGPVWLYGTASEHCVLYQYLLYGAENVWMGNIQTESPYYLPKPKAPAPFTNQVGMWPGDPDFKECPDSEPNCSAAWGLMIIGSTNVHIHGAGLYNWFDDYTQGCLATQSCQKRVVRVESSGQIWLYNLYTIGTTEMLNLAGSAAITAKENLNTNEHPHTAIVNAWLVASTGEGSLLVPESGDEDDDFEELVLGDLLPPCPARYNTLDDIVNAQSNIPKHCLDKYLLYIQLEVMRKALSDYDSIVSNGYQEKFKVYKRSIDQQIPMVMTQYMRGAQKSGNFRCIEKRPMICCAKCSHGTCASKPESCDWSPDCQRGSFKDFPIDCPTNGQEGFQTILSGEELPNEITYTLTNSDGFYKSLLEQTGIVQDWVSFGDHLAYLGNGCQTQGADVLECIKNTGIYWHNFPTATAKVIDPADTIRKSYDNMKNLYDRAALASRFAEWDSYQAGYTDVLASVSVPAMVLSEAIETMRKVAAKGEEIIEQERKANILMFVNFLLMLIPIAGQVAGTMGAVVLRAALNLAGEAGAVAMTLYDLVDDPSNALFTIMGMFLGGVSRQPFRDAAQTFRGMKPGEIDSLPPRIKTDLDRIKTLQNVCVR